MTSSVRTRAQFFCQFAPRSDCNYQLSLWLICFLINTNHIDAVSASAIPNISVFNVSQSSGSFNDQTIDCGQVDVCHIICNEPSKCTSMTINASLATNLILECAADSACTGYHLMSPGPTANVTISCTNSTSCKNSVIELMDTDHVHISCLAYYSCSGFTLNVNNALSMTLHCQEDRSCQQSDFNIVNVTESFIDCPASTGSQEYTCLWHDWTFSHSSYITIVAEDNYSSDLSVYDAVSLNILCSGSQGFDSGNTYFWLENAGMINIVSSGSVCMDEVDIEIITSNDTSNTQHFDAQCTGGNSCRALIVRAGTSATRYCSLTTLLSVH